MHSFFTLKNKLPVIISSWLVLIVLWTLLIKFIFPVTYALYYEENFTKYIMWDFWWIAHLWLANSFLNLSKNTYYVGLLICIFELIIIIYKLGVFFISPQWNIWDTNWMINKIIVLFLFIFITVILFTNKYYILYDLTEKESGS
ncbi:MAG: hypothetical protein HOF44_03610 [Pelagibacterales bacterium]|nr:hypothetical protein [Pelagibacterales bacterium]MBT4109702.1 hypothetical protein [Pelagibacterales bacterium]MDG2268463.1 hypothetical protein [Alphaproteobacteria bacterium]